MISKNIKIKKDNFFLKRLSLKNLSKNYYNWFKDLTVKKFIKSKYKSNAELIKDTLKEINKNNQIFFGIFLNKKNLKHIGNVKFHDINVKKKTSWIGILIGEKKYRNRGFGTGAITVGCKYLFEKFNIEKFYLYVSKKNLSAINSYLNSGFVISKKFKGEILMCCNYKMNKLILGTAQFGKPYGISNNQKTRMKNKEILKILKYSKNKIKEIDTAIDYNINRNIQNNLGNFIFNTKVDYNFFYKNINEIKSIFLRMSKSIKINILFIRDLENNLNERKIFEKINFLKKKKIIKKIGISVYSYENLTKLYKLIKFDVIQVPINIFDNRCDKLKSFILKNNIEVHARSIFLQGLFFFNFEDLKKKKMILFKKPLSNLRSFQKKLRFNIYDIALSHVFKKSYVKKVIIGVHNISQLKKILNFNYVDKMKKINNLNINDNALIDPRLW